LIDQASDTWAGNVMIKNNLTWFIKIPTSIAPGNYVLRHEIIALHAAGQPNGAQNYPFCYNLAISSPGTDKPAGVAGTALYNKAAPGIVFDLFGKRDGYEIPGVRESFPDPRVLLPVD
jgi:lytic cellulose monooxygenase (C1-hydroxylating)